MRVYIIKSKYSIFSLNFAFLLFKEELSFMQHSIKRITFKSVCGMPIKKKYPITKEQFKFFNILSRYYFNDRYPDYTEDAFEPTQEGNAKEMFDKTKEMFSWLQTLKP